MRLLLENMAITEATGTDKVDQTILLPLSLYTSLLWHCLPRWLTSVALVSHVPVIDSWTLCQSVSKCHSIMSGGLTKASFSSFLWHLWTSENDSPVCLLLSVCRIGSWASMFSVIPTICFGFQVSATTWNVGPCEIWLTCVRNIMLWLGWRHSCYTYDGICSLCKYLLCHN